MKRTVINSNTRCAEQNVGNGTDTTVWLLRGLAMSTDPDFYSVMLQFHFFLIPFRMLHFFLSGYFIFHFILCYYFHSAF